MTLRLRALLLASAAPAIVVATPTWGVDVTGERTTPIATSTANNGAADDVDILSGGTIRLDNGVGVTLDSDNAVTNDGQITITDSDPGAVGVRVLGGFTGSVTNTGSIAIDEDYTRTDADGDGSPDGPFAQGSGRTGILIEGGAPFTGDVRQAGTLRVEGDDSRGVDIQTALNGSFVQAGTMNVIGDRSIALNIADDVVGGDVRIAGVITATGEDTAGVVISGDVDGAAVFGGSITATGYQFSNVSNYFDPDDVPDGFEPPPLDGDDLKIGGPAVAVAGSVRDGVLLNGFVGGGATDDVDGEDPEKDIKGDFDENRTAASITSRGSAPAVLIAPDFGSVAPGDLVIGLVVESVRDTRDDDEDDDREEIIATFLEEHGFINRGTVTANGFNVGVESNAVVIRGSQDGAQSATIEGGMLNAGTITSTAFEADATAVRIGDGAVLPTIDNVATMTATTNTETNHAVTVLLIEAGSMVAALDNAGVMTASARGDAADVVAIRDLSGTLVSVTNTGVISAVFSADGDDDDGDGFSDDLDERTGARMAVDLSAHAAGQNVVLRQERATPTRDNNGDGLINDDDIITPTIQGDVLLGAGDDDVQLLAGTMNGALAFGAGADRLTIDGGASYTGALSDSDGQLDVTVADGALNLDTRDDVTVTSLTMGDDAVASFSIDLRDESNAAARIIASGGIDIADGAGIAPSVAGLGEAETTVVEIMRASGGLSLEGGHDIADNLSLESPFLFDAALSTTTDGADDVVLVSIRRRTADELGMTANQASAYDSVVSALNADDDLLLAIVNLAEADDFFQAYEQLLPEYSLSALQFAVSNTDGAIGAVGNRLDVVRGGRTGAGGAWLQEFGAYVDRESTASDPGFRGEGFGVALGVDRPFGPFYAVGLSVVGSASEIEQPVGLDDPLSVSSAQIGAYAAANLGDLLFDAYVGAGADFFESQRRVFVGDLSRESMGDWKGHHATAAMRLAYDVQRGRFFARPAVSVDYLRLDEESFSEFGGGAGIDLRVDERSSELFSSTASLTLGAQFGSVERSWWSPRMRLGYRYENLGSGPYTTARFVSGGDPFVLRADDLPEAGGVFGFTFAAGSRYSSFALDYDADVRDGFVRHGARVGFRFVF